jgi:hypothetical protein
MKRHFLVLFLIVGLGSCFSFAQADPFVRYLSSVKAGTPEPTLLRFATECGVDATKIRPRYAVGPGSSPSAVRNLARGLRSVDTDFYSTAEVWPSQDRVLVEIWANSDDVGSEVRYFKCFIGGELTKAEVVNWNVPVSKGDPRIWGYSLRWERSGNGELTKTKTEFVDALGRTISKPKLDSEGEKSLHWNPFLGSLEDQKLPPSLFR